MGLILREKMWFSSIRLSSRIFLQKYYMTRTCDQMEWNMLNQLFKTHFARNSFFSAILSYSLLNQLEFLTDKKKKKNLFCSNFSLCFHVFCIHSGSCTLLCHMGISTQDMTWDREEIHREGLFLSQIRQTAIIWCNNCFSQISLLNFIRLTAIIWCRKH